MKTKGTITSPHHGNVEVAQYGIDNITYSRCTVRVVGMDMLCPLCKTLVKSGVTHVCGSETKVVTASPNSVSSGMARDIARAKPKGAKR